MPSAEDMNKSFVVFNDDESEFTMLKEDTEDLMHLSAITGDGRNPLGENPIEYVLPDMLDDIILSDCKLLSNDHVDGFLSSSPSSFFSYKDDLDSPSRPLSPMLCRNEDCSIPSLESSDSPINVDSVDHFLDFERIMRSSEEVDDLTSKHGLIPISLDSDDNILPFVTNDFMWCSSSEESTWSSVSSSPTSTCSSSLRLDHNSCLGKLLLADSDTFDSRGDSRSNNSRHLHSENSTRFTMRNQSNAHSYINRTPMYHKSNNTMNHQSEGNKRRYNNNNNNNNTSRTSVNSKSNNLPLSNVYINNGAQHSRRDGNNRGEDRRTGVGNKRSHSENWSRPNSNKRNKQSKNVVISSMKSGSTSVNTKRVREAAIMNAAVATTKQTNSVLMNLLVSGCDLNAGYVCLNSSSRSNSMKNRFNSATTTADKFSPVYNSPLICMSGK